MKELKRLDIFLKVSFVTLGIIAITSVINFVLLLQVYGLVSNPDTQQALLELERIQQFTSIARVVIYLGVVVFLVCLVVGLIRTSNRESR